MEVKFVVEMDIPNEKLAYLKFGKVKIGEEKDGKEIFTLRNAAGLTIDDLIQTRIETALAPLCGAAILIYKPEEGKGAIDRYKNCPACGHPWPMHFNTISQGKLLHPAQPTPCSACTTQKGCMEAFDKKPT